MTDRILDSTLSQTPVNPNGPQKVTERWEFTESQLLSIGAAQQELERRINLAFRELAERKGLDPAQCRATVVPQQGRLALQVERPDIAV